MQRFRRYPILCVIQEYLYITQLQSAQNDGTGDSFNDVLTDLLTKLMGPKFNEEILIGNRHVTE